MQGQSVYVIAPEDGTPVSKIGIAAKPRRRLIELQISSPKRLKMYFSAETGVFDALDIERLSHRLLADKRLNGEWFDVDGEEAARVVRQVLAAPSLMPRADRPPSTGPLPDWVLWLQERSRVLDLPRIVRDVRSGKDAGVTLTLLFAVLAYHNDQTNEIEASPSRMAEDVGVSRPEASRALTRLCGLGILTRLDRGRFAMNPEYAWRGSLTAREQALAKHDNVVRLPARR